MASAPSNAPWGAAASVVTHSLGVMDMPPVLPVVATTPAVLPLSFPLHLLAQSAAVGGASAAVGGPTSQQTPAPAASRPKKPRQRKAVGVERAPIKHTSDYRGVTRHRNTGRWEAHLWDKDAKRGEGAKPGRRAGRQIYLGAFACEEEAARAYDRACIVYWGAGTKTNFPSEDYDDEMEQLSKLSREDVIAFVRRGSSGFSRGLSKFRGVTRHHGGGRWESRIGKVPGLKYVYLGTYDSQEDAAAVYDYAMLSLRGPRTITNFALQRYFQPDGSSLLPVEAALPTLSTDALALVREALASAPVLVTPGSPLASAAAGTSGDDSPTAAQLPMAASSSALVTTGAGTSTTTGPRRAAAQRASHMLRQIAHTEQDDDDMPPRSGAMPPQTQQQWQQWQQTQSRAPGLQDGGHGGLDPGDAQMLLGLTPIMVQRTAATRSAPQPPLGQTALALPAIPERQQPVNPALRRVLAEEGLAVARSLLGGSPLAPGVEAGAEASAFGGWASDFSPLSLHHQPSGSMSWLQDFGDSARSGSVASSPCKEIASMPSLLAPPGGGGWSPMAQLMTPAMWMPVTEALAPLSSSTGPPGTDGQAPVLPDSQPSHASGGILAAGPSQNDVRSADTIQISHSGQVPAGVPSLFVRTAGATHGM